MDLELAAIPDLDLEIEIEIDFEFLEAGVGRDKEHSGNFLPGKICTAIVILNHSS